LLQYVQGQAADGQKTGLSGGKGHQILQVQTQIKLETVLGASTLEVQEGLQRVPPFGRDLRQSQIGAAQLGAQRVDPHEDFRDLVVGQCSLQHVHAVHVLADAA